MSRMIKKPRFRAAAHTRRSSEPDDEQMYSTLLYLAVVAHEKLGDSRYIDILERDMESLDGPRVMALAEEVMGKLMGGGLDAATIQREVMRVDARAAEMRAKIRRGLRKTPPFTDFPARLSDVDDDRLFVAMSSLALMVLERLGDSQYVERLPVAGRAETIALATEALGKLVKSGIDPAVMKEEFIRHAMDVNQRIDDVQRIQ